MTNATLTTLFTAALLMAAPAQAQTTLTFGGSDAIGSILDRQNLRFTACVNDRAANKVKVNFIQGEQLGNDVQVIEQMMQGSVHIYGDVLDWYANWVKDYAILAWGFTFRDADHMQKFLDSPTYAAMAEKLRKEQGLRILAAAPTQPRILFSKKPIGNLGDLNGVKMRVPEIKTYLTLWETLGTRPSRLAWGEIYLGLKAGVVEAAEGPISSAYSAKFHEAATNVIRTDHLMSSAHITVNDKAYAALPADMQKLLAGETATYAFIWMAFVGASVGLKQGRHILITTFASRLPPRVAAALRTLVWALVLITLVVLIVQGLKVAGVEGRSKTISLPIELPRSWFYSVPLTLSAASMALTAIYLLLLELRVLAGRRSVPAAVLGQSR